VASEEDEKRWRAALKGIGTSNAKILLSHFDPLHPEQSVSSVGDRPPWPTLVFIQNWVREQEAATQRKETRRFLCILFWTVVAAGAGILAAVAAWVGSWSEIKTFFGPWLN
jgi:hypothetical protein